jgi:WD40 repeat protein
MWDVRSGECLRIWRGHSDVVHLFRLSADGGTLVSGSDDHTALVFRRDGAPGAIQQAGAGGAEPAASSSAAAAASGQR